MKNKLLFLGYDKNNNLLFKIKRQKPLFIIDFKKERVRLLKGKMSKNSKKRLRKFLFEYYDLIF